MSLCIAAGGTILTLAATAFSLSWTHSVEKTDWTENWTVQSNQLVLESARVEGSGAGIGLPDNAIRTEAGWTYTPDLPPLKRLVLASSGATVSAWTLCADGECFELGDSPGAGVGIWSETDCYAEEEAS